MEQNEPPPSTGLIAGKYQLVGLIGRGGMGSVWEGRHSSLGTRVAIKFIESDYANSKEARERFDNEAHAAARIQSKHAIQIFDHGVTDDGKPYIVMEFLAGEPLDKRVERMGRLSLQETARIIQQVCRGLARAHEQGVIHRDLKPENVFLVRSMDDDDEIAKVLDFGIAKMKGPPGSTPGGSGGVSSSTKTGAVLGTPFYMSPEQARGLKNVDHRTDIWSLGVITYKCVTGVLPFEGESVGDLLVKICTAPLPVPSQFLPGLPVAFDQWFARALDRDPERRFATSLELADALAYSAGVSVRRGGGAGEPAAYMATAAATSQNVMSRPGHTPGGNATPRPRSQPPGMTGYGQRGQQASSGQYGQGPSATSAPFTSSTRVPTSNRGVIISSILAAVVALGVGAFAVNKFVLSKPAVSSHGDVGSNHLAAGGSGGSGAGTGGAAVTSTPAPPTPPPIATVDAADAGAVAAGNTTPPPKPGGGGGGHGRPPKPGGGGGKPLPISPGGASPPPPLPPPPPPPPKGTSTAQDPGY